MLTFFLDSRQHCLAVHAALSCVRGCSADLENLSAVSHGAQIFQVSQQGARRSASRAGTARRADEQSRAKLPTYFKLRDQSTPNATALRLQVQMATKVSSPVIIRLPSALLHITRHPVLAVCVRSCGGKARRRAFASSCARKLPVHAGKQLQRGWHRCDARDFAAGRAASWLASLRGRSGAWSGSWPRCTRPSCPERSPRAQPLGTRG